MSAGGSFEFGKEEIAKYLKDNLPNNALILDVGAGCGTYGYYLKGNNYRIEAIEIWPDAIEQLTASNFYTYIYQKDIREFEYKKTYDLIIFGDILEHLSVEDAQKVLSKAEKYTKAILIAVPYLYEQDALYGNEAEIHLQADLTPELFDERYPGYQLILGTSNYGYYYKVFDNNELIVDESYKNLKICVYAICKNESQFVEKWLDNMSEADYICVLDTGSTDDTFEKLKNDSRVTIVKQKKITPWRFDVARNESLKLVPDDADILVCTDFDELFNKGWADVVREAWSQHFKTNRIYYHYAWSHDTSGEPTDIFTYDKIHNRDFIWKFPVHEVLVPKDESIQIYSVDAHGAIFLQHYPDTSKPRSYYLDLLKLSVEENPDCCHVRMLLAREYLLNKDYDTALTEYLKILEMPSIDNPENDLVLLESLGRVAGIYQYKKDYDEAIWYCHEWIKEDSTYREPYLILAEMYNDMKMYTLAKAMVDAALKYSTRKYNWVERAPSYTYWVDDILSITDYNLGDLDSALKHSRACLKHNDEDIRLLKNYIAFLEEKYIKKEEVDNE